MMIVTIEPLDLITVSIFDKPINIDEKLKAHTGKDFTLFNNHKT